MFKSAVALFAICLLTFAVTPFCPAPVRAWAQEAPVSHSDASAAQGADAAQGSATAERAGAADASSSDASATKRPSEYAQMTLDELNAAVDEKAAEFNGMQAQADEQSALIEQAQARLAQIAEQLPVKQGQAEHAVVERYKVQRQYGSLIDVLLCAQDWHSFLAGVEYIAAASEAHIDELVDMRQEEADLEQRAEQARGEKAALDEQLAKLASELQEVTQARDEKKRKAELVANTHVTPDGADWAAGKDAFVAAWAPRLEAYVKGTPLEGQGETFAKAAWDNHIDPRYSVAISNIESSRGRFCIRPHNAWGWGADDSNPYELAYEWASWEEAINAHARGLAQGFGYTATVEGAQKYCPPNWEDWYVNVVTQMNGM